jgi:uncharacterized membrane protein
MDGTARLGGSSTRASASSNVIQTMEAALTSMNAARHLVVVKAPVERVYEQWSRLEDLPKFIPPLRDVHRIDDTHFSYRWHPDGSDQKGVFHIVLQIPGRRIAWRTMSNGFMSGVVSFEPRSQEETEVTLKIRSIFNPPSLSYRVQEYLGNFKRMVESEEEKA